MATMTGAQRQGLRNLGARVAKAKNPLGNKVASFGKAQQAAMAKALQGGVKQLPNVLGKTSKR